MSLAQSHDARPEPESLEPDSAEFAPPGPSTERTAEDTRALPPLGRRAVLGAAAGAVGAVALSSVIGASPASAATSAAASAAASSERLLISRATYGANSQTLADVHRMGAARWLEWQLNPSAIKDPVADALLRRLPLHSDATPIWEVNYLIDSGKLDGWQQMMSVPKGFMIRAIWGRRQLQTVMEEFWSDLFNVTVPHDGMTESRAHYQYTIRSHSLGTFADLLWAISSHPSMLTYLNNRDSSKDAPNENQGRELLELHSVGVDAGYTEADVLTSAHILTGLSVNSDSGEYEYRPWQHWTGPIKVFGFRAANRSETGGEAVARQWINYLAHHPSTAKRIAKRLLQHFVTETPTNAQIAALASTYTKHGTAIKPVLQQLFLSKAFTASAGQKVRRPIHHVAATVRLLESAPELSGLNAVDDLVYMTTTMGQQPFGWPMPNGYSLLNGAWLSTATTLNRWNATRALTNHWWPNALRTPDLRIGLFGARTPATHGELIDTAALRLFGRKLQAGDKAAILTFLGVQAGTPVSDVNNALSPAIDYKLGDWIALMLDSPYHFYR